MNRKAVSLACVVSLSAALLAGCGQGDTTNNEGQTTTQNTNRYGTSRNLGAGNMGNQGTRGLQYERFGTPGTEDKGQGYRGMGRNGNGQNQGRYGMDQARGNGATGLGTGGTRGGMNGTTGMTGTRGTTNNTGMNGATGQGYTGYSMTGYDTTGYGAVDPSRVAGRSGMRGTTGMNGMTGSTGAAGNNRGTGNMDTNDYRATDQYGTNGIYQGYTSYKGTGTTETEVGTARGTVQGQAGQGTNAMGTGGMAMLKDRNTLVIGNTVIVAKTGMNGNKRNATRNYGSGMNVLEVSDRDAVKALQRVKSKLDDSGKIADVDALSKDLKLVMQKAKPSNQ